MTVIRKKKSLEPGVKYRGYGYVNEFGEFEFIPEEKGAHKGRRKLIKEGAGFSVSETKGLLIVHITTPKQENRARLMNEYLKIVNTTLEILRDYEI